MKLYTEKELNKIVTDVAEKACANYLDEDWIKEKIKDYGYTKLNLNVDDSVIDNFTDDDNIKTIEVMLYKNTKYLEK